MRLPATGKRFGRVRLAAVLAAAACAVLFSSCGLTELVGDDEEQVESGDDLLAERDYRAALERYAAELEKGDESAELYRGMGIAHMMTGEYQAAEEAFVSALGACGGIPDSRSFDISFYLAETYTKEGKNEEAVSVYDAILDLRPSNSDAHYLRGMAYLALGDHNSASEDFKFVTGSKPRQYDRILSIYEALTEAGYGMEGKNLLADIVESDGDSMDSYEKGRFAYYQGNISQAREYLEEANNEKASARAVERIPIVILLGEVAQDMGDDSYAIGVYRHYLQDDQSHAGIYNALGVCEMRMGNYSDALSDFQIGIGLNDDTVRPALLRNIASAYEHMGNYESAAEKLNEYLELAPTDEEALRENVYLQTRTAGNAEENTETATE